MNANESKNATPAACVPGSTPISKMEEIVMAARMRGSDPAGDAEPNRVIVDDAERGLFREWELSPGSQERPISTDQALQLLDPGNKLADEQPFRFIDETWMNAGVEVSCGSELDDSEKTIAAAADLTGEGERISVVEVGIRESATRSGRIMTSMPSWLHPMIIQLGSDHGLPIACILSAISTAAGKLYVLVDGERVTYPNLSAACGCPPATGKTVIQEQIFQPVIELEKAGRMYRKEHMEPQLRAMLHRITLAGKFTRKQVEELSKESVERASEILARLDLESLELHRELTKTGVFLVNDVTPAGLKRDLAAAADQFVGLILSDGRDLLRGLIGTHVKSQASALTQVLLDSFSGDRGAISRGAGTRHLFIENPRMSMLALVQPDILIKFVGADENHQSGLCSRILWFSFRDCDVKPGELSKGMLEAWTNHVKAIHNSDVTRRQSDLAFLAAKKARIDEICDGIYELPFFKDDLASSAETVDVAEPVSESVGESLPTGNVPVSGVVDPLPIRIHLTKNARKFLHEAEAEFTESSKSRNLDFRQIALWSRAGEVLRRVALCRAMLRPDFLQDQRVNRGDVEAALVIVKESADTFTELCSGSGKIEFEEGPCGKLQEILKKNSGSMLITDLVGSGVSRAQAFQLASRYPDRFKIGAFKTGKAGKPPLMISYIGA